VLVTVSELVHDFGLSHGTKGRIIQEFGFHAVCEQWALGALSEGHKEQRMVSALSFLQQYVIHDHDFLELIVTGDETWAHHHFPETKRASLDWKHPGVPAIGKMQDGQLCWQSDGYGVLGPQGCAVSGFRGKGHYNQCSVILRIPRTVTNSH